MKRFKISVLQQLLPGTAGVMLALLVKKLNRKARNSIWKAVLMSSYVLGP